MTVSLALIRHFPTAWNTSGRIQGRTDIPLADPERRGGALGRDLVDRDWYVSPLERARATAALLGIAAPAVDPRLIEMDWGTYEGQTLDDLRRGLGTRLAKNEAHGLDFRPEGGETPREVAGRFQAFLNDIARNQRPAGAITHKGVIRAALVLATKWDMRGKAPVKLAWDRAHIFAVAADGALRLDRPNRPLYEPAALP
ncbi:MAG: histidine phosphatase family protein [Alphaproteobacteria bacterium]|nr:histidine phosphatase family protein [Alphaproteobacteria bacterium]